MKLSLAFKPSGQPVRSFKDCSKLPLAPSFCLLFCLHGLWPDWPICQLPKYSHTSLLLLGISTGSPCLECSFLFLPYPWDLSLQNTCSRSLLLSPKSWQVFLWWTFPDAWYFYCYGTVLTTRWDIGWLFPLLILSLDFTFHESKDYVFLNFIAFPVASILSAWQIEGSQQMFLEWIKPSQVSVFFWEGFYYSYKSSKFSLIKYLIITIMMLIFKGLRSGLLISFADFSFLLTACWCCFLKLKGEKIKLCHLPKISSIINKWNVAILHQNLPAFVVWHQRSSYLNILKGFHYPK